MDNNNRQKKLGAIGRFAAANFDDKKDQSLASNKAPAASNPQTMQEAELPKLSNIQNKSNILSRLFEKLKSHKRITIALTSAVGLLVICSLLFVGIFFSNHALPNSKLGIQDVSFGLNRKLQTMPTTMFLNIA